MSVRQQILDQMVVRLSAVLTGNGYQTNAGAKLFVGESPSLSDADPRQALALIIGDDQPGYQGEHVLIRLPLEVHAVVAVDVDEPSRKVEEVIADIKRAVEKPAGVPDHSLGGILPPRGLERGVTRAAFREQGSQFNAGVVNYLCVFPEQWGNP